MQWDRDWLESMYNNRVRVSDAQQYITHWTQASIEANAILAKQAYLNIAYGTGAKQKLDIFMPNKNIKQNPPPVLVFIHGGYWHALDKAHFSFIAPPFAQAGACVVVVNYTLCPEISVSGIVAEITQAVIWIKRNIHQYGADANRITLTGHSAGGHLTAMMFTRNWQKLLPELNQSSPLVNGLSISGLYDLAPLQHTPFLEILALTQQDIDDASPIKLPCLMQNSQLVSIVGQQESMEFLRQNQLIEQYWGDKQVPLCHSITGLNHFSIVQALCQPQHQVHQLALRLLKLGEY